MTIDEDICYEKFNKFLGKSKAVYDDLNVFEIKYNERDKTYQIYKMIFLLKNQDLTNTVER